MYSLRTTIQFISDKTIEDIYFIIPDVPDVAQLKLFLW